MGNTKAGAKKARETMILKYGDDYYSQIGRRGGKKSNNKKGFGSMDKTKLAEAGRKGGRISKRSKTKGAE